MHFSFRLIWKLLLINTLALVIVLGTIGAAVHLLAAQYFVTLMEKYNIAPETTNAMFLQAVDRYLLIASLVGFSVATALSFWLNSRQTEPISKITQSAKSIAEGGFSHRVATRGCGEVQQLANAFNDMAEHLERGERLRKDFIVDIAHELRTPLTNILGFMEGLRDGVIAPGKSVFEGIHEDALRLTQLVEELMQLAAADLAKSNLQLERINLTDMIQQALRRFQVRLAERSLWAVSNIESPILITADSNRLTQVLTNILENACRYATSGSQIQVSAEKLSSKVRITVSNDVESQPHETATLFERFQRGETSRSRIYGGAGLGLAIVKELVTAHNGQVGCNFENLIARFWFELPTEQ